MPGARNVEVDLPIYYFDFRYSIFISKLVSQDIWVFSKSVCLFTFRFDQVSN